MGVSPVQRTYILVRASLGISAVTKRIARGHNSCHPCGNIPTQNPPLVYENLAAPFCIPLRCTAFDCYSEAWGSSTARNAMPKLDAAVPPIDRLHQFAGRNCT